MPAYFAAVAFVLGNLAHLVFLHFHKQKLQSWQKMYRHPHGNDLLYIIWLKLGMQVAQKSE